MTNFNFPHHDPDPARQANNDALKLYLDSQKTDLVPSNVQTGDYTLALSDSGNAVEVNSASAHVVTVPANSTVAFPVGTIIEVARIGAGTVTLAAAGGVTIRSELSLLAIGHQYGAVSLRKRATDEWLLVGELA